MAAAEGFDPRAAADAAWVSQGAKPSGTETSAPFTLTNAADLVAREFKEPKWAVPQIIAEGLTILAGRPKTGKSWAVLDFAVAVAGGYPALGNIDCQQGACSYLRSKTTSAGCISGLRRCCRASPHLLRSRSPRNGVEPIPVVFSTCNAG